MNRPIHEALRDIVERHGTAVIDDVRRCEACIREASLAKPEVAGLVTALREGIPKRLLRLPAGTLSRAGMATLAAELAHNGGLNDAVAQRSVEAWAYALRLAPAAADAGQPAKKPEEQQPLQAGKPAAAPSGRRWTVGKIVWLVVLILLTIAIPAWIFGAAGQQLQWWQIGFALLFWCKGVQEMAGMLGRAPPDPKTGA